MANLIARYTRADQGLAPITRSFGQHDIVRVALHHTAGPRAATKAACIRLNKQYDEQHRNQGWGGIGYHLALDDYGRLYYLRPKSEIGAHTSLNNTGTYGITVHGNYDIDSLNWLQRRTLKRLYRGQVTDFKFLGSVPWKGHQEFPGPLNATACPGKAQMSYLRWLRSTKR
jgi:N-acetylmuramoyl-L-alanine amidase